MGRGTGPSVVFYAGRGSRVRRTAKAAAAIMSSAPPAIATAAPVLGAAMVVPSSPTCAGARSTRTFSIAVEGSGTAVPPTRTDSMPEVASGASAGAGWAARTFSIPRSAACVVAAPVGTAPGSRRSVAPESSDAA